MDKTVNIRDFRASCGNGALWNGAVDQAIKSLGADGGTVYFPAGEYYCGTIFLESNITLLLDSNAVIYGSKNIDDYSAGHTGCIEAPSFNKCLLFAEGKENITVRGYGKIIGNGGGFTGERPMLTRFVKCRNIVFEDVSLGSSGAWCNHFVLSTDIYINRVKICNHVNGNNDGLDFDNCKNVYITNCSMDTGDDSICLKSSTDDICENFLIMNCRISSNTAAIKTGTASRGGFKNIVVNNCIFHDCTLGCIKLICVDGGTLENVSVSNIIMDNVGSPLFIRIGKRNLKFDEPQEMKYYTMGKENDGSAGYIKNIMISDVRANVSVVEKDRTPIMITGLKDRKIENVQINNINLSFAGGGDEKDCKAVVAEDEFRYPEQYFFGVLPAYAMFARHIDGLRLSNIYVNCTHKDLRPPFIAQDVINQWLSNCNFKAEGTENV